MVIITFSEMDPSRFYHNPWLNDNHSIDSTLVPQINPIKVDEQISSLFSEINEYYRSACNGSLYSGSLGKVYLLYRLGRWKEASAEVLPCTYRADNRITLLEGRHVGALAMSCVIHFHLKADTIFREHSRLLLNAGHLVRKDLNNDECEVMYGRSGFVQAILFVRKEIGNEKYGTEEIHQLIMDIMHQGMKNKTDSFHLLWKWHHKIYLGSAHGVAGILQTLISCKELVDVGNQMNQDVVTDIKATIMSLISSCVDSGNLPSSMGNERDSLVQWCHGAVGLILLLVKSYETFKDVQFLYEAERLGINVVWPRGLLKKGVGLCHGISGNAYAFLALHRGWNLFQDRGGKVEHEDMERWLNLSWAFAEFAMSHLEELRHVPDHPYSLFEGLGGLCCLLMDLKHPIQSGFPLYEF